MKRILLLVTVLILYGSLYPWEYQEKLLPDNPLVTLLSSWPTESVGLYLQKDVVINLALYVPFGVFCYFSISQRRSRILRAFVTILAAGALSFSIELAQLYDTSRVSSMLDVTCNVAGAAIGLVIAIAFPTRITRVVHKVEEAGAFRLSGSIVLLYVWAGYQIFPLLPALSRTQLRQKLAALMTPAAWSAGDVFDSFGGWLALSVLLQFVFGTRRIGRILAVSLFVLPLKLFIVNRTISGSEVAGALVAISLWLLLLRRLRRPMLAAGLILAGTVLVSGLVPFRMAATPSAFSWVPFLALLRSNWEAGFVTLLRKAFLYGSAVWLLNENGRGWLLSSAAVAALLAIVEVMQRYLPGRTPEITDPLLALLIGIVLMLLERHSESSSVVPAARLKLKQNRSV